MRPALQRRRRQLLTRRSHRRSPSRGVATVLVVLFAVFGLMISGSVVGTAGGMFAAYNYFATGLPDPRLLDGIDLPQSTHVYDRTGNQLLARFECQNRESVAFGEIPEHIVNATIAAEDRTFWSNDGIDYYAVGRAALANLEAGGIVQGASTITQQVIKYAGSIKEAGQGTRVDPEATPDAGVGLDPDDPGTAPAEDAIADQEVCTPPELTFLEGRGFEDKIREQIMARQMTEAYPGRGGKERILAAYLNLIFYGNGSYGIKAAAANYFGLRDISEMSVAQAAFLAGLPQRPTFYDPYQNPDGAAPALARRDLILRAMLEEGYITTAEYRVALRTTWEEMNPNRIRSPLLEPHFTFRVQREAEQILASMGVGDPQLAVRTGGYRIVTTLDYELQQVAKQQVAHWVAELGNKNVHNGALVAIDSNTGEIVSYVGSVDYYNREDPRVQGQFDVAGLGLRQPGSAYKPITYASAFRSRDATVATMFVDAQTEFGQGESSYRPSNADLREHGPMMALDALRYSLNIPSVMMQYLVGADETARFSEEMGIASAEYIMALDPGLTLTLGSVPVSLTNMTQAYGAFAQEGEIHPARTIKEIRDRDGRLVYSLSDDGPDAVRPLSAEEAYLTHWILEAITDPERNVLWGANSQLLDQNGERRKAGFKTGTTNDFRDVTGFGYIPGSLVTGVWMGNNNMEPMSDAFGQGLFAGFGPVHLWREFMLAALNQPWDWNGGQPVAQTDLPQPPGIVMEAVCRFSGLAATDACGRTVTVPFIDGTQPPRDNVHRNGCLDLERHLTQDGRPSNWIEAAEEWSDRTVNGDLGAKGDLNDPDADPETIVFAIAPLYGEPGLPSVCGTPRATPTPRPAPEGNGSGNGSGDEERDNGDEGGGGDDGEDGGGDDGEGGGGGPPGRPPGPPTPPPSDDG